MSHKIQVVLPDPVATQLYELAAGTDEPPSTLAGQLVRNGVALAAKDGKVRPLRSAHVLVGGDGDVRPHWLEPYGGDTDWRKEMWGQIVALHGRYPRLLAALKDEWWNDEAHTETPARLPCGGRSSTTREWTRAKSSPSRTGSSTTPRSSARNAAASPRHGSPERRPRSGPSE